MIFLVVKWLEMNKYPTSRVHHEIRWHNFKRQRCSLSVECEMIFHEKFGETNFNFEHREFNRWTNARSFTER